MKNKLEQRTTVSESRNRGYLYCYLANPVALVTSNTNKSPVPGFLCRAFL